MHTKTLNLRSVPRAKFFLEKQNCARDLYLSSVGGSRIHISHVPSLVPEMEIDFAFVTIGRRSRPTLCTSTPFGLSCLASHFWRLAQDSSTGTSFGCTYCRITSKSPSHPARALDVASLQNSRVFVAAGLGDISQRRVLQDSDQSQLPTPNH